MEQGRISQERCTHSYCTTALHSVVVERTPDILVWWTLLVGLASQEVLGHYPRHSPRLLHRQTTHLTMYQVLDVPHIQLVLEVVLL